MLEIDPQGKDIDKRVRAGVGITDIDERFRVMDRFGEYAQIINLVTPPVESYGPPAVARELAQIANDGMAEHGKKPVVKLLQIFVGGLVRAATEMGRNAFPSPLELALVEEP